MDFFDSPYYRINKVLMSLVGLWPNQQSIGKYFALAFAIYGMCTLCISQFVYIIRFMNDLDRVLQAMPVSMGSLIIGMKIVLLSYNSKKLKLLLTQLKCDWEEFTIPEEVNILKKYAEIVIIFTSMFFYLMMPFKAPILDIVVPLNESRTRTLISPGEHFINSDKYYYILLFNEYMSYIVIMSVVMGTDTLYIVFIEHVCGIFSILSYRLENLKGSSMNQFRDITTCKKEDEAVCNYTVACIKLHVKAKRITDEISSAFSVILFWDIGLGILMHSACCVMIVIRVNRTAELMRYTAVVMAQSLRLFSSSYPGQRLVDHSTNVCMAAYSGLWYKTSLRAKKLLLLLMIKSQTACTITAANLYVIKLDCFGAVMRTSLSYCTVMASLHDATNSA